MQNGVTRGLHTNNQRNRRWPYATKEARRNHEAMAKRYSQLKPACKKPFNCLNATASSHHNNNTTWWRLAWVWLRWPNGDKLGSSWAKIWARSNSSQVGGQTILNSIEVVNLAQVALSWEDRLARALANKVCVCLHRTLQCSEACGGGLRHRNLSCQQQDEQGTLFPVAAMACAHAPKLETEELCNEDVLCSGLLLLH